MKRRSLLRETAEMGYLSATARAGTFPLIAKMQELQDQGGPGAFRQAISLMGLAFGPRKVRPEEYYTYALWREDRGSAFLNGFMPNWRTRAFNTSLGMPDRRSAEALSTDKLANEAVLAARGLPLSRSRALFLTEGQAPPGLPDLQILRGTADLVSFLSNPAIYPLFGKPRADSYARGAAVFQEIAKPGVLRFLDGRAAPIDKLAAEIATDWGKGYIFQPFYRSTPELARHTGPAMASVRIVTLWTDAGVEPWYGVIRLPAKTAMHDGDALDQRIWGLIDLPTGTIVKLRDLRDPTLPDLTHGHDPEQQFLGTRLPDWDRAVELCCLGHESFPADGIIGWDVFLTADGTLLNEANGNPGHVYQVAAQRPLLNPDTRPAYERALAFARKHGGGKVRF